MSTALTVYNLTTASSTLSTAGTMVGNVTGGALTNKSNLLGTATGFDELDALADAGAWAAAGSLGAPSGHGYLWDVTTLEQQQILAGTWTPKIILGLSAGTATADLYTRLYVRSSGGTYTQIGSNFLLSAQALSTTNTTFTWTGQSIGAVNFGTGDKLYQDFWANVTANSTGSGAATLNIRASSTAGQGNASAEVVTPGYQPNGDVPMAQLWWFAGGM